MTGLEALVAVIVALIAATPPTWAVVRNGARRKAEHGTLEGRVIRLEEKADLSLQNQEALLSSVQSLSATVSLLVAREHAGSAGP